MKKILIVLSLIMSMIMLASCGNDAATEKHDFRNVDLGMTAAELIAAEGEPDEQLPSDTYYIYTYLDKEVYGIPHTTLKYDIDDGSLWEVRAEFTNSYDDDSSYIKDYNTVKENLIKEWGEPDYISEDDSQVKMRCRWGQSFLELIKKDDNTIKFELTLYDPAKIDSSSAP